MPALLNLALSFLMICLKHLHKNVNTDLTFVFQITVDITPPTIENCPSNIRLTSQFGELVVASWITPTVSDNSGFVELLFLSHMSLSQFPVGDTAVSYIYVDPSNNQAACTFIVTVEGRKSYPKYHCLVNIYTT